MLTFNATQTLHDPLLPAGAPAPSAQRVRFAVTVTNRLEDVEVIWRQLTACSVESPGQNYDFIRLWIADKKIAPADQRYVLASLDGSPIALLPLHRKRVGGIRVLSWFPGANAGSYAPVADYARLANLGPEGRAQLWATMKRHIRGADVVYLRSIPAEVGGFAGLFDELGVTLEVETLYRSQYANWEECDKLQRSKSRRKHDRQQGDRLNALGELDFAELSNADEIAPSIEEMFRQRSARFKAMGIRDTFVHDNLIGFYHAVARPGSGVDVRLHVLRLNGDIVAVRYNIVHGDRMFCLISSMSDDPAIQGGSPGKQCLLRVMQTVFENGMAIFDMGSGFTDEKRHWCNVQLPLRQHYIGLTPQGMAIVWVHQAFQRTRAAIKANKQLKSAIRFARQRFDAVMGHKPAPPVDKSE